MQFQANALQKFEYVKEKFGFLEMYKAHLMSAVGCEALEDFHKAIPAEKMPKDVLEGTAHTYGHDILYAIDPSFRQAGIVAAEDRGFVEIYRQFMRLIQDEIFQSKIVFQRLPSLRIHYPGFTSYGVMHTDREYNHPPEEINIWVPITRATKSASMLIESEIGKADYQPVEMDYGELLIFDSGLTHGNGINHEGYTRMSFDMRVIPRSIYEEPSGTYSTTAHREFRIGDYYDEFVD